MGAGTGGGGPADVLRLQDLPEPAGGTLPDGNIYGDFAFSMIRLLIEYRERNFILEVLI